MATALGCRRTGYRSRRASAPQRRTRRISAAHAMDCSPGILCPESLYMRATDLIFQVHHVI
eukprot:3837382-Pyramimonas_sp.AAC.1